MKYGLIGKKLPHSLSPYIHNLFGNNEYIIKELEEDELESFIKSKDFLGINVTLPYKEKVISFLDYIDPLAKEINGVNVIVNKNNKLYGYNTDYYGFDYLLKTNNIDVHNKKIMILGSGGTSKMVEVYLKKHGVKDIKIVSRNPNALQISYELAIKETDVEIIINTTPKEMYPHNEEEILSLDTFNKLEAVIDVIYNPLKTNLLLKAEAKNVKAVNGLSMLLEQARLTNKLFFNEDKNVSLSILKSHCQNIVLIGMPSVGKSFVGEKLATCLKKEFIDLDDKIEQKEGMSISKIFKEKGEDYFRKVEEEICKEYAKKQNQVIATGGGIINLEKNMYFLKQNGIIIYMQRDLDKLIFDENRPLTKDLSDYKKLYEKRIDKYLSYQDYKVSNNTNAEDCIAEIIKVLEE